MAVTLHQNLEHEVAPGDVEEDLEKEERRERALAEKEEELARGKKQQLEATAAEGAEEPEVTAEEAEELEVTAEESEELEVTAEGAEELEVTVEEVEGEAWHLVVEVWECQKDLELMHDFRLFF